MEDPIEKLHKLDRLTDAVYCHTNKKRWQGGRGNGSEKRKKVVFMIF
jgi:hypothetical protein